MGEPVLIASLAGERVAFRAGAITTVIELDKITPVPRAPSHVAGIGALRSRGLVVIDCQAALEGTGARRDARGCLGVVIAIEGHAYALMVDAVHDVTQIDSGPEPVRVDLPGNWKDFCEGQVEVAGESVMLVDPASIVAGQEHSSQAA
ncbi:chemotaxis protein CheW [Aurantiacibacter hainanensis]|uniref:chemotaxis protein CheW n=1 Tax=Aurantiacibacter hainanensis TaxID=3076114 RepID=UPI0030C6950C